MGDRAADEGGMPLPVAREIADELPLSAQEPQVLDAFDRTADIAVDGLHAERPSAVHPLASPIARTCVSRSVLDKS
jgi:hypothetical protein